MFHYLRGVCEVAKYAFYKKVRMAPPVGGFVERCMKTAHAFKPSEALVRGQGIMVGLCCITQRCVRMLCQRCI
jgi:hypothetical protein